MTNKRLPMVFSSYYKLLIPAAAAAVLALTLRRQNPELSMLVSAAGCALGAAVMLGWMEPILDLGRSLCERAGLEPRLTEPLWKTAGIGFLTQVAAAVCADAGQSALARIVELGGGILCLVIALPLLEAALSLIGALL